MKYGKRSHFKDSDIKVCNTYFVPCLIGTNIKVCSAYYVLFLIGIKMFFDNEWTSFMFKEKSIQHNQIFKMDTDGYIPMSKYAW